jgi:transcriptional regulator with XRE-family HTH domain
LICTVHVAEGKANTLSELTGISKSAIQSWITTRMRPRLDVLLRMCSRLGLSIAAILTARYLADVNWEVVEGRCSTVNRGYKRYRLSDEVRCEIQAALRRQSP